VVVEAVVEAAAGVAVAGRAVEHLVEVAAVARA
jgi:hypothetical protein